MSFHSFFREDNFIFRWSNYILDMVVLSTLWLFLSLPVVTAGGATAALYFTVSRCTRQGQTLPYGRFLHSFRENWKVGVPCSLLAAVVLGLLWAGITLMRSLAAYDSRFTIVYSMYYFLCVIPLGVMCYAFPLLGRFHFGVKDLIATAFQLSLRHLPTTVVLVVLAVLTGAVCTSLYWTSLFLPAVTTLLMSFLLERVFRAYLPEQPAEAPEEEEELPE